MKPAGIVALAGLVVVGGLTQGAPRMCLLPAGPEEGRLPLTPRAPVVAPPAAVPASPLRADQEAGPQPERRESAATPGGGVRDTLTGRPRLP
jgi:hypothetical protein